MVAVLGDAVNEPTETFMVNLSTPMNATMADAGQATGTITNDDRWCRREHRATVGGGGEQRDDEREFTVTLSGASAAAGDGGLRDGGRDGDGGERLHGGDGERDDRGGATRAGQSRWRCWAMRWWNRTRRSR